MHTQSSEDTLVISGFDRLSASNAHHFKELAIGHITDKHRFLDVDCSQTGFIDSAGLGVLISVQRRMSAQRGEVRILNPIPFVQQLLELLRMNLVFQIIRR